MLNEENKISVPEEDRVTDEEVLAFYAELEEFYGDNLANFDHYPRQFAKQVTLYRYYKSKEIVDSEPKE